MEWPNKTGCVTKNVEYQDESIEVQELPTKDPEQLHVSILNCYGSFGTPDEIVVAVNQMLHHSPNHPGAKVTTTQHSKVTTTQQPTNTGMKLPVRKPPPTSPRSETAVSDDSGILSENRDDPTVSPAPLDLSINSNSPRARLISPSSIITAQRSLNVQDLHTAEYFSSNHSTDLSPMSHMRSSVVDQTVDHFHGYEQTTAVDLAVQGPSQTIEIVPEVNMSVGDNGNATDEPNYRDVVIKTESDLDTADSSIVSAGTILGTVSVVGNPTDTLASPQQSDNTVTTIGSVVIQKITTNDNVFIKEEPMDEQTIVREELSPQTTMPVVSRKGKSLLKSTSGNGFKSTVRKCRGVKVMTRFPRRRQNSLTGEVVEAEKRRKLTVRVEDFLKIRLSAISRSDGKKKPPQKQSPVQKLKQKQKESNLINQVIRSPPAVQEGQPRRDPISNNRPKSSPLKAKLKGEKVSPKKEKQSPKKIQPTTVVAVRGPVKDYIRHEVDYHVNRRKFKLPENKILEKITMNLPGNTKDFIEEYRSVKEKTKPSHRKMDERTRKIVEAVLHNPKNERFKRSLSNFKKGIFLCQICNKRCRNRKAYVRHQKEHSGAIDVYIPYITKGIGPVSKLNKSKVISLDDVSSGESEDEERYECRVCGKVLQSKRTYRHHKTIHQRIDPTDLPRCRLCGTFFTKMTSLHHHLRTAHFICWQCGDRRKNIKDLNHHRRTAHSALCEICGMSCASPKALTQHAAYHFLIAGPKEFKSKYQIRKEKWREETGEGGSMADDIYCSPDRECGDEQSSVSTEDGDLSKAGLKSELDPNEPRPYLCQCGRRLKTWDSFQAHSMIHRGLKPYSCPVCKKGFLSSSSRKTHVRHVHSDDRPYRCVYCDEKFKSSSSRDVHTRLHHTKEKPHKCDECGIEFSLTSSLKSHKQAKHSVKPDYACKICSREFKLPGTLAIHMRQHTGEKPYVCGQCGKAFRQGSHLRTHVRTHSDERLYPCQICQKSFTQSSHLNTHMKIHKDCKEHKCEYCGKGFNLANTLKTHLRIHTGEKPFKCSICDRSFNQSSARNSHEKCHSNEKPLECEICGSRFKLKGTLKTHMLVHSKELPYKCTQCDKAFTTSSSLKLHVNTKHDKNLKYACSHCSKKFVAKHLLDRHEVTHFDASCECRECGKVMKNKFTLKSHMKKYHNK